MNSSSGREVSATTTELAARAARLIVPGGRRLLGIAGPPGAGKSTLARSLSSIIGEQAMVVPLDGFHLANEVLETRGLTPRKGAPETFDAGGFRALLSRLRRRDEPIVYAPEFHRGIEQAIVGAIPVPREVPLIIVEGNYLLLDDGAWKGTPALLDEVWYLSLAPDIRRDRLIQRHRRYGRSENDAQSWTLGNDELNAQTVNMRADRATYVVSIVPDAVGQADSTAER